MSKKNQEVKENIEKEEVINTPEVIENNEGDVKTTEPSVEAPEIEKEEVKENKKKNVLVADTSFKDKYTSVIYPEKTEFVVVDEDVETTKIAENKYKISKQRAEEIKAKGYIK